MNKNEVKLLYEHFKRYDYLSDDLFCLAEMNLKDEFKMAAFLYLLDFWIEGWEI